MTTFYMNNTNASCGKPNPNLFEGGNIRHMSPNSAPKASATGSLLGYPLLHHLPPWSLTWYPHTAIICQCITIHNKTRATKYDKSRM